MSPDAQHQRGLTLLREHVDAIRGAADRQTVRFVGSTWRRWLGTAGWDPHMIDALVDRFPREVITRPELRDMAADASDAESRGGLLVATLMWGRGKRNGRMRDHIINLLKTPSLNGVLAETSARAAAGDPAGAYRSWALPGLREAFFTKWLWAASYIGPTDQHCLVLDSRVWTTLNKTFEWSSVVAAGTISDRVPWCGGSRSVTLASSGRC